MKNRCLSVFKTCQTPYYSRCRLERHEHGAIHSDKQGRVWMGQFDEDQDGTQAVRLPFYFDVTTDERGTTWKLKDVASGRTIARSPARYATIDEAHAAMGLFQATVRGPER
jgi:hypothetical protein